MRTELRWLRAQNKLDLEMGVNSHGDLPMTLGTLPPQVVHHGVLWRAPLARILFVAYSDLSEINQFLTVQ